MTHAAKCVSRASLLLLPQGMLDVMETVYGLSIHKSITYLSLAITILLWFQIEFHSQITKLSTLKTCKFNVCSLKQIIFNTLQK